MKVPRNIGGTAPRPAPNALHSSQSTEHFTPPSIVRAATAVLGTIDLDPASCPLANKVVGATRIFTKADDGLAQSWKDRVFLNPPGKDDLAPRVLAKHWYFKLAREWHEHRVSAAIFIGFSLEILQTVQVDPPPGLLLPYDFLMCVPARRIAFSTEEGGEAVRGKSPPRGNVIVYLPVEGTDDECVAFQRAFSPIGRVILPSFERWRDPPAATVS